MKVQSLPPGGLLSVSKYKEAKPQLPAEREGASLVEAESFMSLNVQKGSDVDTHAGGQTPCAFSPAFGKLKMLASEACHKNYVIFDRCEGKSTVILHPSRLKSPPGSSMREPYFAGKVIYCGSSLQMHDRKWIEDKLDFCPSLAALSTAGVQAAVSCKDATGMQSQPKKMVSSNEARCSLIDFVHTHKAKKDIMRPEVFTEIEGESCKEFHENTEEIDALLSSDDELSSTGHSPSSDASSNGLCSVKDGHDINDNGKKRKLGHCSLDEVDDADSGSYKPAPDLPSQDNKRNSSCIVVSSSKHTDIFSGVAASEVFIRGDKSSSANDVFAAKSECKLKECSGTFRGGPAESSKRMMIQSNVRQLRSVVPGGDCLDTAGVLGQTIQYVKCLQRRLRDLEAAKYF